MKYSKKYTKKGLELVQLLFNLEFDTENELFYDQSSIPLYGTTLLELIPKMSDIALDESFYSESDSITDSQNTLLALIYYTIKSVKLKTLFHMGFKPKHLQFIIINFPQSIYLPRVICFFSRFKITYFV